MTAWLRTMVIAALTGLLAAGLLLVLQQQWQHWQQPALQQQIRQKLDRQQPDRQPLSPSTAPVQPAPTAQPVRLPFSYADAVAAAAPSVVSIRTASTSRPATGSSRVSYGLGSGVIWRQDGLIITNFHIIRDAEAIAVEMSDGRTLRADIVGSDPATDLALLRINAGQLSAIARAPQAARVGDVALAIGYPILLGQSVTVGIISATERLERAFIRLIQTDAAINRGNSGGALVNARGEWIGINSAVLPAQLGVQGIGFAIPADYADKIAEQILSHGRVIRGSISFVGSGSTNEIRSDDSDNQFLNAVRVDQVDPNGPAAAAGLQPGDWITHFNDELISSVTDLLRRIADSKPGSNIRLRVSRADQLLTLTVTVIERPPDSKSDDKSP